MMRIDKDELRELRKVGLLAYLETYEPGEIVKVGRGLYSTREHDSIRIYADGWYRFSTQQSGKSAIDYLVEVRGLPFGEAADAVRGIAGHIPAASQNETRPTGRKNEEKKALYLPKRDYSGYADAVAYLASRGIDEQISWHFIKQKLLYQGIHKREDGTEHRCLVFVGYDKTGTPGYGSIRYLDGHEKRDAAGSSKSCGFFVAGRNPPPGVIPAVRVFESGIDLLSDVMMCKLDGMELNENMGISRLALASTSTLAIERVMADFEYSEIRLFLDADEAGRACTKKILDQYSNTDIRVMNCSDNYSDGWDVNQCLMARLAAERESASQKGTVLRNHKSR